MKNLNALKTLVLIPCYNEEENIVRVVKRLKTVCPEVDYLVINDCSTDDSAALLKAGGYNYLDLPVNLGIGGGVQCGYRYARDNGYAITVQMDGDGQHDPAYLPEVIGPVADGKLDMCIGSRFITHEGFQTSFMRRVGIRFLSGMIRLLCGQQVLDVTSGFRATSAGMTAYFAEHYATDYPEPEAILSATLAGYRVGEAPVVMCERQGGVSSISSIKSVYYMVKVSLSLVIDRLAIHRVRAARPRRKGEPL
ncbi:MAG: glycosyltransferase family 2 protein [Gemmiger sp.]|nr:glycosyltransferase family 2 protein [Gemmiger sp.]